MYNILGSSTDESVCDYEQCGILDLPAEMMMVIASQCVTHREVSALRCTCNYMYNNMDQYMNLIKMGEYTLNKYQEKYCKQVLNSPVQDTHIKMPMSSGKTALGIAIAHKHPGPAIIVVPSSVLDHWLNEFNKIWPNKWDRDFNLQQNSTLSQDGPIVYILHRSKHRLSYDKGLSLDSLSNNDIFICTSFNSMLWKDRNGNGIINGIINTYAGSDMDIFLRRVNNNNIIAIFDEIHTSTVNARYKNLSPFVSKTVTLSADNTKALNKSDNSSNKIVVGDSAIEDCIPQYEVTNTMMFDTPENIKKKCLKIGMPGAVMDLMYNVYRYTIKNKGKTFVFLPSTNIFLGAIPNKSSIKYGKLLSSIYGVKFTHNKINDRIYNKLNFSHVFMHLLSLLGRKDYTVLHYENIDSLNEFESSESDKCILFSTPRKVQVGININNVSNVLFLITPLKFMNNTIYSQCIGRFRRVNNMQKSINVHNIIFSLAKIRKYLVIHSCDRVPNYICECSYGREKNDMEHVFCMNSYAKSLTIPHELLDDFKSASQRKTHILKLWSIDQVDPLNLSDCEYLYLMYGVCATKDRKILALKWLKLKEPNSKYAKESITIKRNKKSCNRH